MCVASPGDPRDAEPGGANHGSLRSLSGGTVDGFSWGY